MPITLPVLDDRNYEQILEEALRRIPVHTPEWTNFGVESDPGVTIVQLFAFMTDSLLYRANRIPELNRLKFLQLLNIPLQPAVPADGLVAIQNERGPVAPLLLEQGVVLTAGNVQYVTRDPVNVLPAQAQVYYKRAIPASDAAYETYRRKYEAVLVARLAEQADLEGLPFPGGAELEALGVTPQFYEPTLVPLPKRGEPLPAFNIETGADRSLYLALLAPENVPIEAAQRALARQVLTIGMAPATAGVLPPLQPQGSGSGQVRGPGLVFEIADASSIDALTGQPIARYNRLTVIQQTDVFSAPGIVMVELPAADRLTTWFFDEPMDEGTAEFPPRIEDDKIAKRLITWLRIRLPTPEEAETTTGVDRRLAWLGINAARIVQAVPVFNEYLAEGTGEPDQFCFLANVPVIPATLRLAVEELSGTQRVWQRWGLVDDLQALGADDRGFALDSEAGAIRFGDGLHGKRPRGRILASYEFGGGPDGNVAIGAINASPDPRLAGGYKIANPIPTGGGAPSETVADGERRIPLVLRHRDRLVTRQDFRDITYRTPGVSVGRVEVLTLFRPKEPDVQAAGAVTVMVVPRFDPEQPLWPDPDRLFLRRVCDHLDARRLVTTEIYVRGPDYVLVYVSVGISVRAGYFVDRVEKDAEARLREYLSSLPPGGPDGLGWPLNKRLVDRDLQAVVTRVPGVEYVDSLEMGVMRDNKLVSETFLDLSGLSLPRVADVTVRQGTAEPLATAFATEGTAPSRVDGVPIPVSRAKC